MDNTIDLVDRETGEVVNTLEAGDRILRKKSLEAYARKQQRRMRELESGEKVSIRYPRYSTANDEEMAELTKRREITLEEHGLISCLRPFMGQFSCAVLNEEGEPATLGDIARMTGCGRQRIHNLLKMMTKKKFIGRWETGRQITYFINPWLTIRSTAVNATLVKMFGRYRVRSMDNRTWEQILSGEGK